jgi:hypothetical protein
MFDREDPEQRRIIIAIPTLKKSSTQFFNTAIDCFFNTAIDCILNNLSSITDFYDTNIRFNKLKFNNYIKKQSVVAEISKRLLSESKKYGTADNTPIGLSEENGKITRLMMNRKKEPSQL